MENNISIKCVNMKKQYKIGDIVTDALKGVNFEVNKGEFIVILGPSGSGKSTMLNMISGLDTVSSGDIFVDGEEISKMNEKQLTDFRRRKLGFIFQQYNLLPNLKLEENIEVGAYLSKNSLEIEDMIEKVGLTEQKGKYPHQLSGGQQQRVSIARALVKNPEILFCDEPTGALDENTAKSVLEILQELNEKMGTTIVFITHNPGIAEMAHKVIRMNSGEIVEMRENEIRKKPSEIKWS